MEGLPRGNYLDPEALRAALEAKGAEACPICGSVDAAIPVASIFLPIPGVTPIGGTDPNPPQGIEAACVICPNCGFIRLHDVLELMGE